MHSNPDFFALLLTEADPGGELAEGSGVWVVTEGAKEFEAHVNEGLQHGHPPTGTRLGPVHSSYRPIDLQRGQGFVPVYWLQGDDGRREHSAQVDSDELYALALLRSVHIKRGEKSLSLSP